MRADTGTTDTARWSDDLFNLSRPVRPGEKIDYFLSHSWHDDNGAKWRELVKIAERFKRKHGRGMTLWLDKAHSR